MCRGDECVGVSELASGVRPVKLDQHNVNKIMVG